MVAGTIVNKKLVMPKTAILMKIGFHGTEELNEIMERKRAEIMETGYCFWGYGGTLCHPLKAIQPFIDSLHQNSIEVLFVLTPSLFHSDKLDASEYSIDGISWQGMPRDIRVSASKFALVIKDLKETDSSINTSSYEIAIGPSQGKPLPTYLRGRVDKALITISKIKPNEHNLIPVAFRATLVPPYAVLLR